MEKYLIKEVEDEGSRGFIVGGNSGHGETELIAGEKTKLEILVTAEITFPTRNIATSFCFFIACSMAYFDL